MWPPMCTRRAARGRCCSALRSKSSKDMHRSSRLQSTNSTCAPALTAASGVAMNVFDGHSTVRPRTPANSSAARAPPVQLPNATEPSSFHAPQASSKRFVSEPSDHWFESNTSSHSACSRGRSRGSNPIAKREWSMCRRRRRLRLEGLERPGGARHRDVDRLRLARPGDQVERGEPVEHELERERLPAAPPPAGGARQGGRRVGRGG